MRDTVGGWFGGDPNEPSIGAPTYTERKTIRELKSELETLKKELADLERESENQPQGNYVHDREMLPENKVVVT
ncbi:dimethyladenosine transferase [Leptospira ryugenii]|uniref:Dimethyladenosine transferase n=1 Tax=Leptospira ryugenii TaxID=1917863 RepID=A0A2P2E5A5_9LEPT|nr:hypothetical protein [Leptospira ryugenii]GBF52034.1 dimethyladenosine transferase [Leptospira ryugenii]